MPARYALKLAAAAALTAGILPALAQQRACGLPVLYQNMAAADPQAYKAFSQKELARVQSAAENPVAARTTAQAAIPVVFHFVLTGAQYNLLGRDTGILRRVYSQMASLNQDFTGQNADRVKVPAAFATLFDAPGIQFGLGNVTTGNTIAPGVEVKLLSSSVTYDVNNGCAAAKNSTTGLAPADTKKYLNVWVVNIYNGSNGQILGVTIPPDYVGYSFGSYTITQNDLGIVLSYGTVGKREFNSQYFFSGIDQGRTLTHETGHYLSLRHVWGDDNGACPSSGGYDDGISDTPPQADATYCNRGTSGTQCPTFPLTDACSPSGNGIMFMNYMDYVNDAAMFMFTKQQSAVMRSEVQPGGSTYNLTQNPQLLSVNDAGISAATASFEAIPNPASDRLTVRWDAAQTAQQLALLDVAGRLVQNIPVPAGQSAYQFDLSQLPRGLYVVRATFAEGTAIRKVVLQ